MITALTAASTSASAQMITGSEPPSSSVTRFSAGPAIDMMWRPVAVSPVKAMRRTSGWPTSASPMLAPRPGDDVQHAVGHAGLGEQARDLERGQRRGRRGLGHHRVAAGQRRRDLGPQQGQREVVGRDRRAHAHGAADDHPVGAPEGRRQLLMGAAHLGRRLGVVAHAVGEVGDLAARLGDRLALLGGQQRGELLGVLVDQRGRRAQDVRALLDVGGRPCREGGLRSGHRQLDVGRPRRWGRCPRPPPSPG